MKLSDIVVRRVNDNDFSHLHKAWYKRNVKLLDISDKVMILHPWIHSRKNVVYDYESLIGEFLTMSDRYQVSVRIPDAAEFQGNQRRGWVKDYAKKINEEEIAEFAKIARQDDYKRGNFELYFKTHEPETEDRVTIRFAGMMGTLIGYEMIFPKKDADLFNWENDPHIEKNWVYGLWVTN